MIMIVGGAFQGKTEYAKTRFDLTDTDILNGADCDIFSLSNARCIKHYELAIKKMIETDIDPIQFTENLSCDIVIINEIGCGIIPLEKSEREWREITGRAGCILAEKADEVVRVCCGIATMIKGDQR